MTRKLAYIATLVLIFTIPWETAITLSSLGTITRLVGFGAAGIWIASVLITGKLRKLHAFHIAVFLFMLLNVASVFWTVSLDLAITRVKTYLQLLVLIWLLWDLFKTPESLRMVMQIFIFGAYVTITSQLINFASGKIISTYEQGRFTGAGQNANEFSLILSLTLPIAWFLATTQKPGAGAVFQKIINIAYIPLALLATILTASRTALLTDLPGLLYITGTMNRFKPVYRALVFIVIITAFLVIGPLIPESTYVRLATIGDSIAGNDLGGRVRLWTASLAIFLDHPILGIGSNALSASSQLGTHSHNTFLSIAAELGLVGIFLFLVILAIVILEALKQPKPFSTLWITVIIVWFIGVFSLSWEYTKTTWYFLSLIIISAGIYTYREKHEDDSFKRKSTDILEKYGHR